MNSILDMDEQLERWLAENIPSELLETPLPDEIAIAVIERLKQEADRHWFISPNRSLELATRIVAIGQARADVHQTALGLMAQGDALKFLGRYREAWKTLDQAGKMFESVEDEVGWARTRIGRLYLGLKLNCAADTLADVERARTIFAIHDEQEKLIRLEINTAYVYNQLGDQHQALRLYNSALTIAEALGEIGQQHLGLIHMNIGFAHGALGDLPKALANYEKARNLFKARNETRNIANIELNIAYIAQSQGRYRQALRLLYSILQRGIDRFPLEELEVKRDLIECYLCLNRYSDARDLARQVIVDYKNFHAPYDIALTLLHLATAEAELGNFKVAQSALYEATPIFTSLGATTWSMIARLRHGQIALKQGNLNEAYQNALSASNYFQSEEQQGNYATASLLMGHVSLLYGDFASASTAGKHTLQIARRQNVPSLRYAAYLLLGRVADALSHTERAIRCYQAAAATIERVQRRLTITLRSGFLEDKVEAGRELVALYLRLGQVECAFEALERAKSQVLLSYIGDREQFHWIQDDPESRVLLDELRSLRAEHQWFYQLAHEPPKDPQYPTTLTPEKALEEVGKREQRMRAITEQLYLHSGSSRAASSTPTKSIQEIQQTLDETTQLVEYYNDGKHIWAFILDRRTARAHRLPVTTEILNQLIRQLQVNIATALKFSLMGLSDHRLTHLGQRILQRLYSLLVEPLGLSRSELKRLMIVPYGALHYLPFNLLHNGSTYLIEDFDIVILPAATLTTHPGPKRSSSALVLAHTWEGRLPQTQIEAQVVHQLFGGTLRTEEAASRAALQAPPAQILHIAAHGRHRLDQPDLSFIQLADGQLYADDLLQQDLSYELVTLSGCETGQAQVAGGDELIGLGRGLLYAGAGALILSLWQVADSSTVSLMEKLYRNLQAGRSKSAALREAQLSFLIQDRQLHPAFWGAFQLIGNDRPLSILKDQRHC
jgi:CHAT domain-containing protein